MDFRQYQKEFLLHHAVARMIGTNTSNVNLACVKLKNGNFAVGMTSAYPPKQRATCNDPNNPWREIEDKIDSCSNILFDAIDSKELKPIGCNCEPSQIDLSSALFHKSDIITLLKKHNINDEFFNPKAN